MKKNDSEFGELITAKELSARLCCTTKLIDQLVRRRLIPVIRLGYRSLRYDWRKVQDALARLEIKAVE